MPTSIAPNIESSKGQNAGWQSSVWLDFLGVFCVFFIYAGSSVPAINEPHYWTKAAHFWNPEFGKGDIFLESGDAHWIFFATFGYLTQVLPLVWAVSLGRVMTWVALAVGWTMLGHSLFSTRHVGDSKSDETFVSYPMQATAFAVVWLAAMHWGHWAGEWVVGGCESKGIAYACIFLGIGLSIRRRWNWAWVLFGIAAAFHVVTGIWVIACLLFVSYVCDHSLQPNKGSTTRSSRIGDWMKTHRIGWLLCCIGVFVGAIPALSIDWGTDPSISTDGAVMQAYKRLGHHLSPTRFSLDRWKSFGGLSAIAIGLACFAINCRWSRGNRSDFGVGIIAWLRSADRGIQVVLLCSFFAFGVAFLGLLIDVSLSFSVPQFASKILKYYWFRWNDVAFPMGIAAIVVSLAYSRSIWVANPRWSRIVGWTAVTIPGLSLLLMRFNENFNERIPAGDKANLVLKTDSEADQVRQYHDWLQVCDWIANNTDQKGLWLTPRRQQSFKWRTGRPELACWKDAPQNAVALVQWGERLADAYKFEGEKKTLQPLSTDKLWELQKKYSIRYVLLDRRVANQPAPALTLLYPGQNDSNESFWVYEFPAMPPPG